MKPITTAPPKDRATIETLIQPTQAILEDMSCNAVLDLFHKDKKIFSIPVVDQKQIPVGIVIRQEITEIFSRPFMKELAGDKPISSLMNKKPIIVNCENTVEDVVRIILDAGIQHMVSGFIITKGGKYLGMGNGHDLIIEIMNHRQQHLFELAHFDQLTGLPNRTLLLDRLGQAISAADRADNNISLLFIDLDGFKEINDTYGHDVGDWLLKEVSDKLSACVRDGDTVARLGGDEFVVVLLDSSQKRSEVVAGRILERISQPYMKEKNVSFNSVSASIGIAKYPKHANDINELMSAADLAMYVAKKSGKNQYYICREKAKK